MYSDLPWLIRQRVLGYFLLVLVSLAYGYGIAAFGLLQGLIIPFLIPLAILAVMILWLFPEFANPPLKWIDRLFIGYLFAFLCWPDYLAVALPGLPWITAIRLLSAPLMVILLLCAFGSPAFRARLSEILSGDRWIARGVIFFIILCTLTIAFSANKSWSLNKLILAYINWFGIFFVSCWFFTKPGAPKLFAKCLLIITIYCIAIGLFEAKYEKLPWAGHIPSFFKVEDPRIDALLEGIRRAASGLYRVQSKFMTSIGLGEFLAMSLPFILHLFVFSRSITQRIIIAALLPIALYIVIRTDSRLAFGGFLSSLVLYVLINGLYWWRNRKDSLLAAAVLAAYPAALAVLLGLSLVWRRLHVMVWGGGAAQFSTQSRQEQIRMGIPIIEHNPFGHGLGRSASVLGYIAPGQDFLTIDNYYLSLALDVGLLGLAVFVAMFGWAAWRGFSTSIQTRDPDVLFLAPASIAIVNFMISKSIYSEVENHALAFMMLGMTVALLYRYRVTKMAQDNALTNLRATSFSPARSA